MYGMQKEMIHNGLPLSYETHGRGNTPLVLIHGLMETSDIWHSFIQQLPDTFRSISLNLPGHGKSAPVNGTCNMQSYARSIAAVLSEEKIDKAFLVGHSMGGYAALAFAEYFPERLSALSLFHSSPFADSNEKKQKRTQVIRLIQEKKKEEVIRLHTKEVYAEDNREKFSKEIATSIQIAEQLPEKGITDSLTAMKNRKDRAHILRELSVPFLYILGKKDLFISLDIKNENIFPTTYELVVLENSGHMGMIEEAEKSAAIFSDFQKKHL
ncbi:MAG: hypothetical protein CSB06_02970 [Bacteroidia bacterium]|nr:MAG: hypothetical protein CSB06_02970 [Bacteroidia bacterium]